MIAAQFMAKPEKNTSKYGLLLGVVEISVNFHLDMLLANASP